MQTPPAMQNTVALAIIAHATSLQIIGLAFRTELAEL
jgi:hypothetical protein